MNWFSDFQNIENWMMKIIFVEFWAPSVWKAFKIRTFGSDEVCYVGKDAATEQ